MGNIAGSVWALPAARMGTSTSCSCSAADRVVAWRTAASPVAWIVSGMFAASPDRRSATARGHFFPTSSFWRSHSMQTQQTEAAVHPVSSRRGRWKLVAGAVLAILVVGIAALLLWPGQPLTASEQQLVGMWTLPIGPNPPPNAV